MNIGLLLLAIAFIAMGAHILLGRERAFGWTQKRFRKNVDQLREVFPEEGKPSRMIVPAMGSIVIGVLLVVVAFVEGPIA